MDDHTYVELLAELTAMGKAPTDDVGWVLDVDEGFGHFWRPPEDDPRYYRESLTTDAHNAIRVAAEDVLREWCKGRKKHRQDSMLMIDDYDGEVCLVHFRRGEEEQSVETLLGTGPTLAVALLNAVRAVRGRKEKT